MGRATGGRITRMTCVGFPGTHAKGCGTPNKLDFERINRIKPDKCVLYLTKRISEINRKRVGDNDAF